MVARHGRRRRHRRRHRRPTARSSSPPGARVYDVTPLGLREVALRGQAQGLHRARHRRRGPRLLRLAGSSRVRARARRAPRRGASTSAPTSTARPRSDDDGGVFVGTDGDEVVRLDPDDGRVVWRAHVGGYVRGALVDRAQRRRARRGLRPDAARGAAARGRRRPCAATSPSRGRAPATSASTEARSKTRPARCLRGAGRRRLRGRRERPASLWRFATGGDVDAPVTLLSDGRSSSGRTTAGSRAPALAQVTCSRGTTIRVE